MHRKSVGGRALLATFPLLASLSIAACSAPAPPAITPAATPSATYDARWLDNTTPRAALDEQGQLNRAGVIVGDVRRLGHTEAQLPTSDVIDGAHFTCSLADGGLPLGDIFRALRGMSPAYSASEEATVRVAIGALHTLCPEHSTLAGQ